MKKVVNKTVLAVILALSMLVALFCGLFTFGQKNVAEAADKDVTVKVEAFTVAKALNDKGKEINVAGDPLTSFAKGTSFMLRVTVTPTLTGGLFDSLTLKIGALTDDKTVFDTTKCGYFTFTPLTDRILFTSKSANISNVRNYPDDSHIVKPADIAADGFLVVSIAKSVGNVASDEPLTFDLLSKVNDDVPDGTEFHLGVKEVDSSQYTYCPDPSSSSVFINADNATRFGVEPLGFTVKEPSNVCTLDAIKAGQGDNESDLDAITDLTNPEITVYDVTKPISIFPTLTDGNAKIELLKTGDAAGSGTAAAGGKVTKFDIPADGKIRILVTAENGTDTKEYVLTVISAGAKLTALTATTDTKITGIDQGLNKAFDSATLEYEVIVPSDSTKVTINATLSTGTYVDSDVYLKTTGSCATSVTSAASATDFDVTGIKNADTLTITARATKDGTPHDKDYEITFKVVDVATDVTLSVVGSVSKKTFANDATKATAAGVDYYYVVAGETNASSTVTITYPSTALEIKLDGNPYTAAKTLTNDKTHVVSVKAQAGNTKEYKFILKNYMAIKLKAGVTADFLHLETDGQKQYRNTYTRLGWTHGVSDLDLDKFVIGNLNANTTVNKFVENFEVATSTIRLYNTAGTLVYDCGTAVNDYSAADLADDTKPVGTGWKLEYFVNGKVEETIYLSVLGDLNGDGYVNAVDMSTISGVIKKVEADLNKIKTVEVALAAYIMNKTGNLPNAADISAIGYHISDSIVMSTNFANYK